MWRLKDNSLRNTPKAHLLPEGFGNIVIASHFKFFLNIVVSLNGRITCLPRKGLKAFQKSNLELKTSKGNSLTGRLTK